MNMSSDENKIHSLYHQILAGWNERDAAKIAALYADDGNVVGFDGSQINGRAEIEAEMTRIFTDHQTGVYVGIVRQVRFLSPDVALLRAVSGMIPPGQSDLNPNVNTIQSLVATRDEGEWHIALYQNTPAQFHGRPELVQSLTQELRQLL